MKGPDAISTSEKWLKMIKNQNSRTLMSNQKGRIKFYEHKEKEKSNSTLNLVFFSIYKQVMLSTRT